jgi:hypothetical protein
VVGGVDVNHREQADQVGGIFRVVFKGVGGVRTDFQGPDNIAFDFEVAGQGREVAVKAEDIAGEGAREVEEPNVAAERGTVFVPDARGWCLAVGKFHVEDGLARGRAEIGCLAPALVLNAKAKDFLAEGSVRV